MIALWMLYAAVLAAVVSAVASCADRLCRLTGRATRAAWAVALLVSFGAPVALALRPAPPRAPSADAPAATPRATAALDSLLAHAHVTADAASTDVWRTVDGFLLAAWVVASGVALGWLGLSRRQLQLSLRHWTPASVDGETVLVAPDVGPAAVAEQGGRIVLPRWALALDESRRALMLAHERSHLAARDPQLIAGATGLLALMPWNPALWWQYRRLRTAVEIDCDARVLRRHPDVARYGALLLDVARRTPATGPRFAAAFSAPTPTTSLERRIRSMTTRRPRHVALRALGFAALGTGLAVAACEAPHPTGLRPDAKVAASDLRATQNTNGTQSPVDLVRVKQVIAERLPDVARGTGATQMVYVVENASGQVVKAVAAAAPPPAPVGMRQKLALDGAMGDIDAQTIATVDVMKLAAGRAAPDSTNVVWIRLKAPGATAAAPTALRMKVQRDSATAAPEQERVVTIKKAAALDATPDATAEKKAQTAPLYLVDGVERASLDGVARDAIASVNVLKGPAAIDKYGARGTNGVIEVTTKSATQRTTRQY